MDSNTILKLTVNDLKTKLNELNLTVTGRKKELQDRLLSHFNLRGDDDTDSEEELLSTSSQMANNAPIFSLNDIRNSITMFEGTGSPKIEEWLQEFEDNATTVGWDDIRKFIYAKQLIKGTARSFIRSQTNINSWQTLKTVLIEEFGSKFSIAEIHRRLDSIRKWSNETNLQFLYRIMEIGKPLNLDEESVVDYFVHGLPDSPNNKSSLYEATSIQELKAKIKAYEKRKSEFHHRPQTYQNNNKKCTACPNLSNHNTEDCQKLNKLCFKCNKKGHKASDCRSTSQNKANNKANNYKPSNENNTNQNKTESNNTPNQCLPTTTNEFTSRIIRVSNRIYKTIGIKNIFFEALFDTGSDVSLLPHSILKKLQETEYKTDTIKILGIANQVLTTLGHIETIVTIDNISTKITFHIVNDSDVMNGEAIIGNDILEKLDINLTSEGAIFKHKTDKRYNKTFVAGIEFKALCTSNISDDNNIVLPYNLTITQKTTLKNIIDNYKPQKLADPPIKMSLTLTDEIPIFHRPRQLTLNDQKTVEKQINEWLESGIIRTSTSQYASPIVLVKKKDGNKRLCCDYRKINTKIVRDNFPMVLIDDIIQKLSGAKIFSTLDLKNGFLHVPIVEESKKYTSFVTHHGQYEFNFVPFGISNSPAVFCRFITAIFHELIQSGTIIIYMDDIVIPSETKDENLTKLTQVLNTAAKHNLNINFRKCQFLQSSINFLGYIVTNSSIQPSREKTKSVVNFTVPTDQKSLQRFLGLTSYFRRFIPNYAEIARPLTNLLAKNTSFNFSENQQIAFLELKTALAQKPVLKIYNQNAQTEVHTDASMYGYGAVLLQKDSETGQLHPVEYMSRKATPAEQKYHSYEQEVLAIVQALKKWRCFLLDKKFKLITDCNAFVGTTKKKEIPLRVSRWIMFLQDYNFDVEHRSGSKMRHVDALSRIYTCITQIPLKERIRITQDKDPLLNTIRQVLKAGQKSGNFYIKYDILYKDPDKELIVIPEALEKEIIEIAHKQGHFSAKKTIEIINKNYYIPELETKAKSYVESCLQCMLAETKTGKKEGFLNPIDKSDKPLQTLHIDHLGPMETTKKQYNYILTVVDAFSKFTWIYPTKSTTADEVINRLQRQAAIFGNPLRIISDRGTAFTAKSFQEYCSGNNIEHHLITTGLPRANGQVERIHRIILSILTKLCIDNKQNWYKHTDTVQQLINSTSTRSTKYPPFQILTGLEMRLKNTLNLQDFIEEDIIQELELDRNTIRNTAKENLQRIREENRKQYNKKRKQEKDYIIGQLVAIKRTQFGPGLKIKPKFLGPYKIIKKKAVGKYEVEKVGENEGPLRTTTTAEYMKSWQ